MPNFAIMSHIRSISRIHGMCSKPLGRTRRARRHLCPLRVLCSQCLGLKLGPCGARLRSLPTPPPSPAVHRASTQPRRVVVANASKTQKGTQKGTWHSCRPAQSAAG